MAVPPNCTALTAADLGTLPASVTLDVTDAPASPDGNNSVWYKYTAAAGEVQIGLLAFAAAGFWYAPEVFVYLGPASAPQDYPTGGDSYQIDGTLAGISIPVTPGTTYFFQIINSLAYVPPLHVAPGTPLVLTVTTAPVEDIPLGALLVTDDVDHFNAVVLHQTTGAILRYLPLRATADFAAVTSAGVMAFDAPAPDYFVLNAANFSEIRVGNGVATQVEGLSTDLASTFYVAQGYPSPTVRTISAAGVVGGTSWAPTITLSAHSTFAMAPSRNNTILYYAKARTPGAAIQRWDLVNDIALADLVAGIANKAPLQDILVLSDGTIVVGYTSNNSTAYYIKHYSAAGATLHTYNNVTDPRTNRLAMASDDPLSFWSWYYPNGPGGFGATGRYSRIRIADGVVLATFDQDMFVAGVDQVKYRASANGGFTVTPTVFGPSFSCGFVQLRVALPLPTTYDTTTEPIRRLRRFPLGYANDARITIHEFQALVQPGVGTATGQGSDPHLMFRLSRNGGITWGPERLLSPGKQGEYSHRARTTRLGQARRPYGEITTSDPVPWQLIMGLWNFDVEPD